MNLQTAPLLRPLRFPCLILVCGFGPFVSAFPQATGATPRGPAPPSAEIPYELRRGDLLVHASVNGSRPIRFDCDTGCGITTIRPYIATNLNLQVSGRMTIVGIAGEEQATTYRGAILDFNGIAYSPRRIAVIPSEDRPGKSDGTLGAGFFRRFVIEIDPESKKLRLHEPATFNYQGRGERIPLRLRDDVPVIHATIALGGSEAITGEFVIDTGCDGYACLERPFVETRKLLDRVNSGSGSSDLSARFGIGGKARVRTVQLDRLQIGNQILQKPSADFFLEGSPADPALAGHIGMGAWANFKVTLDYSRKELILEPVSKKSAK
jgi:predicted aspartyl protease